MMTLVSLPEIYWPQLALSWYRIFERTRCGGGDLREGSSPHKKSSNECSGKLTGKIEKVFKQLSDLGGERPGGGGGWERLKVGGNIPQYRGTAYHNNYQKSVSMPESKSNILKANCISKKKPL